MKFKVGDIVECHVEDEADSNEVLGLIGEIIEVNQHQSLQPYLVKFKMIPGHRSNWREAKHLTWWIKENSIRLSVPLTPEEEEKQRIAVICKKINYLYDKEKKMREKKKCQSSYVMKAAQDVVAGTTLVSGRTGLSALAVGAAAGNHTTSYVRACAPITWSDNRGIPF